MNKKVAAQYTLKEAADLLNCSEDEIFKKCAEGELVAMAERIEGSHFEWTPLYYLEIKKSILLGHDYVQARFVTEGGMDGHLGITHNVNQPRIQFKHIQILNLTFSAYTKGIFYSLNDSFELIMYKGDEFKLNKTQAIILKFLYEYQIKGGDPIHQKKIHKNIEKQINLSEEFKMDKVFLVEKNGKRSNHPLFGTLIVKVSSATYKLNLNA